MNQNMLSVVALDSVDILGGSSVAVTRSQVQQVEKDVTAIQLTLSQAEVCLTL